MTSYGSGPPRPGALARVSVPVTTDASGDATAYSEEVTGRVLQMRYVPDGTSPLDTGADIVVTGDVSGAEILTQADIGTSAFTAAPRQATHNAVDGTAANYAATFPVNDYVWVAQERIKVVVANGGNTLSGTFVFYVG